MSALNKDAIVRIKSSDPGNSQFGTGFIIRKENHTSYILTCAHVVEDVGGEGKIIVDDIPAKLIAKGEKDGIDLAVLAVEYLDSFLLTMSDAGKKATPFIVTGFSEFNKQTEQFVLRQLDGVLGDEIILESDRRNIRIKAWDLKIEDDFYLKPGYSGSPVADKGNGEVFAVASHSQSGGKKGYAISVSVLSYIWPDMPADLVSGSHRKELLKKSIPEMHKKLCIRIRDIKPIFKQVINRLKQMEKKQINNDDETLLFIVDKFLSKDLSGEDFIEAWLAALDNAPPTIVMPNYEILAERLSRGEIIPFLGGDVADLCEPPLPSLKELAEKLALDAKYPDFEGSLTMISQYYQMTEYGRKKLLRTLKETVEPISDHRKADRLFQMLAEIRVPIVVISTSYDSLLEGTFQDNNKKFVEISHLRVDSTLGEIILKFSEETKPEQICSAETISELNLLEDGYSIIYKVCGCLGIYSAEKDSLMISEEDFFSFAKAVKKIIPDYIIKQISNRGLLFLRNNLSHWQERLVLSAILEKIRLSSEFSYAVNKDPGKYERAFWKFNRVDLYCVELDTFVNEIIQRMPY